MDECALYRSESDNEPSTCTPSIIKFMSWMPYPLHPALYTHDAAAGHGHTKTDTHIDTDMNNCWRRDDKALGNCSNLADE